jgi:hypothetical protein
MVLCSGVAWRASVARDRLKRLQVEGLCVDRAGVVEMVVDAQL